MKKRISFLLVAVLLLATLIPALPILAADEVSDGQTVANTFNADDANPTISTKEDYIAFFNAVWKDGKGFDGKTVSLLRDITFNDTTVDNWYAQAGVTKLVSYDDAQWRTFNGKFEGGNHTLKGVIVEGRFIAGGAGIFPGTGGASIKNLNIDGFYVCATESRFGSWVWGRIGIGGLVGVAVASLTVEGCTLKNGIVTAAKNVNGTVGALVGSHQVSDKVDVEVIDSTVSDVQLLKGESSCEVFGGIWGNFYPTIQSGGSCIDLSGSYFKAIEGVQPVGVCALSGSNVGTAYYFKNDANGFSTVGNGGLQRTFSDAVKGTFPDDTKFNLKGHQYGDNTEKANTALAELGCYGEIPTVKLLGVQQGKNTNDVRFVGLVAKAVVDDKSIDSLGFRLTVGETTVDESQVSCTKVYETILADGETLPAPDGYYFFTFVVTGVEANTEFTFSAVATVGEKVCFTTDGGYIYSAASSES